MAGLGVNIDHVATLRQARRTVEPDPVWAAVEAELGGADGITFHLRTDRRHISDRDARLLRQTVRCKLNMEMSLEEEIVAHRAGAEARPGHAGPGEPPGDHHRGRAGRGRPSAARVAEVTRALAVGRDRRQRVHRSAAAKQVQAARDAGCDAIEIHTGTYANATGPAVAEALEAIRTALEAGLAAGLIVHGGHGLTYNNIRPVAAMAGFAEFNIGHSIVSRAVFVGLRQAVAEMKRLLDKASR